MSDADREIFGFIGSSNNTSELLSSWNAWFDKQGIDAVMSRYPCTVDTIQERLSEMFHFDRRGYIVGDSLQSDIVEYLDEIDDSAKKEGKVDTIVNKKCVQVGYWCNRNDEVRRGLFFDQA